MGLGEAILLGLVQGLTEFLPVSSSAHLRIVGELIGSSDPGAAFTAITQLGTETAVILYFRRDIARIATAWWRAIRGDHGPDWRARAGMPAGQPSDHDALMAWFIVLGSLPIVILGLAFQDAIEQTFRNLWLIALTLAGFGLVLGWADKRGAKQRELTELTGRHAVQFGFWQALALIPGVSRSGGTITGGLLMGYTREAAARYSFLLAIPAVLASGLLELYNVASGQDTGAGGHVGWLPTLVAALVAFAVGYVVIVIFLKIVSTYSYLPFVIYRIVLGCILFAFIWLDVIPAGAGT